MRADQGGRVFAEKIGKREWGDEPSDSKRVDKSILL